MRQTVDEGAARRVSQRAERRIQGSTRAPSGLPHHRAAR